MIMSLHIKVNQAGASVKVNQAGASSDPEDNLVSPERDKSNFQRPKRASTMGGASMLSSDSLLRGGGGSSATQEQHPHAGGLNYGDGSWRNLNEDDLVVINVSGTKFELPMQVLKNSQSARLRALTPTKECEYFMPTRSKRNKQAEYYFNRDPQIFGSVVAFLSGHHRTLHLPGNICTEAFDDEMEYFGLQDAYACQHCNYYPEEGELEFITQTERDARREEIHNQIIVAEGTTTTCNSMDRSEPRPRLARLLQGCGGTAPRSGPSQREKAGRWNIGGTRTQCGRPSCSPS